MIKFSFSTLVADNLAAHLIGGFQTNFNAGYICRRCFITYAQKALPMDLVSVDVRTMSTHDNLVQQLSANALAPMMGVVGSSPISYLIGFHPISSLPADVMHDMAEGVCPIVLVGLLKQASMIRLLTYGKQDHIPSCRQGDRSVSVLLPLFHRDLDGRIFSTNVLLLIRLIYNARSSRMKMRI